MGWGIWIAYATNPPSEPAAMLQYLSRYVPGLYGGTSLTPLGVLAAACIMAVFVAVNWLGVRLFANVNGALTVAKFAVPALTVAALFASWFHRGNYTGHGGFAPYGFATGLPAIATAGIIYAYTGFQGPIGLAGEARNPRRDVPWAVVTALVLSKAVYLALQTVFIGDLPGRQLIHGWSGVSLSSPFAQLAVSLNLTARRPAAPVRASGTAAARGARGGGASRRADMTPRPGWPGRGVSVLQPGVRCSVWGSGTGSWGSRRRN